MRQLEESLFCKLLLSLALVSEHLVLTLQGYRLHPAQLLLENKLLLSDLVLLDDIILLLQDISFNLLLTSFFHLNLVFPDLFHLLLLYLFLRLFHLLFDFVLLKIVVNNSIVNVTKL